MFNIVNKTPLIGYKITNIKRDKKYGIAANNYTMFLDKARQKFPYIKNCKIYLAKDGTEVFDNEYFDILPAQTLFVITEENEVIQTDFEIICNTIRNMNKDLLKAGVIIKNFVNDNQQEFHKFLHEYQTKQNEIESKLLTSYKTEHPEWFLGMQNNVDSKEIVMSRRAQDRIRGYFYKVKDDLMKSKLYKENNHARKMFNNLLDIFKYLLIGVEHFGMLFNRKFEKKHVTVSRLTKLLQNENDSDNAIDGVDSGESGGVPRKRLKITIKETLKENDNLFNDLNVSLCSDRGDFICHGLWNENICNYRNHKINPYANRENAILFQMWNFDHCIEISRSVIPSIILNVHNLIINKEKCKQHNKCGKNISVIKYFLEIFTMNNLKLVHIVCHDKAVHNTKKSNGTIICEQCNEYTFLENFLLKMKAK